MTQKEYNNGVRLWADDVYRYAVQCCGDREQSKDLVQDAFEALWKNRSRVEEPKGKSFLLSVVHNKSMSLLRHAVVHESVMAEMPQEIQAHPDERFDLREALQQALSQLPQIQREALQLKDVVGYSCQEIAEILAISETQVTVYLYRARVTMKRYLIALGYDNNNR